MTMTNENTVNLVIETNHSLSPTEEMDVEEIELSRRSVDVPSKVNLSPYSSLNESDNKNDSSDENPGRPAAMASLSVSGGKSGTHAHHHHHHHHHQHEHTMAKSQSEIQVGVTNSLSVSQTSKNSLMTFSSSGTFYDHATARKKVDLRITPKRAQHVSGKDATDFRQMEQGLLQLLEDFHSGKLEAFGQDCTFQRMENVREQQERLARLHFDLNAQQELCGQHSEEGIKVAKRNLSKLTENLQELSRSIYPFNLEFLQIKYTTTDQIISTVKPRLSVSRLKVFLA